MSVEMNVVALIFARGGSKRLPRKNLRKIQGTSLLCKAIEQALAIEKINWGVFVSTDCEEIANESRANGASVILRPPELASDTAPELVAWKHAVHWLEKEKGLIPDALVSMPTTSPLRAKKDVENCINLFFETSCDLSVCVTPSRVNPYFNMVYRDRNCKISLVGNDLPHQIHRSQDAPKVFDMTTIAYVFSPSYCLEASKIFDGDVRAIEVPNQRALDIDTEFDFLLAELLAAL